MQVNRGPRTPHPGTQQRLEDVDDYRPTAFATK